MYKDCTETVITELLSKRAMTDPGRIFYLNIRMGKMYIIQSFPFHSLKSDYLFHVKSKPEEHDRVRHSFL